MSSSTSIRQQLEQRGLRPNKKLGQNFLLDEGYLRKIAKLAEQAPELAILEVGTGLGALTLELASSGQIVKTIEIDRGLFSLLEEDLVHCPNVELVLGDVLQMDVGGLFPEQNYQVIANIPYYLTSKLIRQLTESAHPPKLIHLLVQKEVALRACEDAPDMNLLSLSIRLFGQAAKLFEIPAGAFYPAPKVDSAILRIEPYGESSFSKTKADEVMRFARAAFQQKRKTLLNSLSSLPDWEKAEISQRLGTAGIDGQDRPQHLTLDQWLAITAALS